MSQRHIVLVTGLAGSGTSRISEHLHRSGLPMVVSMAPPPAGSQLYLDWEDYLYLAWCGVPSLTQGDPGRVLDYMNSRFQRHRVWGVKSPFLLPHLDLWRMCARQLHAQVTVVLTERAVEDCRESITSWGEGEPSEASAALIAWNEKTTGDWQRESEKADYRVPFGWMEFPITEVKTWVTAQRSSR